MRSGRQLVRTAVAAVVTLGLAAALAASSGGAWRWYTADATELRLSWSMRPERIEQCRTLDAAELEKRPVHMRRAVECEGRAATYTLLVLAARDTLEEAVVTGGGLRQDRPIFLLRSYSLSPGARQIRVQFTRREPLDSASAGSPIPSPLVLDTTITFEPGAAVLVSYQDGAFVVRGP